MKEIEHRRHHVRKPGNIGDSTRGETGDPHDERDAQRALIQEDAMTVFTVLPERLAVIACDDEQRAIQHVMCLEGARHSADLRVEHRQSAQVRARRGTSCETAPAVRTGHARRTSESTRRTAHPAVATTRAHRQRPNVPAAGCASRKPIREGAE